MCLEQISQSVHLRSRGEDRPTHLEDTRCCGSPPLARRGRRPATGRRRRRGFTSARAERTLTDQRCAVHEAVHLRSRGEDDVRVHGDGLGTGSPPLARRGPPQHEPQEDRRRFTSARAERTRPDLPDGPSAVHLRSRGEDRGPAGQACEDGGSPPLARRGHVRGAPPLELQRFTSARAERTSCVARKSAPATVHLRSRGEDNGSQGRDMAALGSPPLARRGPAGGSQGSSRRRFTSARAERTLCAGSSPSRPRFTSARAERTPVRGSRGRVRPVHLRSRGEDNTCVSTL